MSLPANIVPVQITGKYEDVLGNPIAGQVRFTPRAIVTDLAYSTIVISNAVTVTLDGTGAFSVYLPPTDAAYLTPSGWTYLVAELFGTQRSYDIAVPSATVGALDLSSVVPSTPNPGTAALYVPASSYAALAARETALEAAAATIDATITSSAQRAFSIFITAGA